MTKIGFKKPRQSILLLGVFLVGMVLGAAIGYHMAMREVFQERVENLLLFHGLLEQRARVYLDFLQVSGEDASNHAVLTDKALECLTNYLTEVEMLAKQDLPHTNAIHTNFAEQVRAYLLHK